MAWLSGYSNRRSITVQQTYLSADQTDFPLLVKITADANLANCLSTGYDVRFTASDGETLLAYDRAEWSGGNGSPVTAIFYVRTSLASTGTATKIYIYWGKAGDSDAKSGANTWSAATAVYYMNDASGNVTDAKGTYHLDQSSGTPTYGQTGQVGQCMLFDDASSEAVWINNNMGITAADLGMEVCFKSDSITLDQVATWHGDKDASMDFWALVAAGALSNDPISAQTTDTSATNCTIVGYTANTWYHMAGRWLTGTSRYAMLNGVASSQNTSNVTPDNADRFGIGGSLDSTPAYYFSGYLDEVVLYDTCPAASWFTFRYRNLFESDNELTWGTVESTTAWPVSMGLYAKRRKFTVQRAYLDADLTDFPLLLVRSNDSGMTGALATGYDVRITQSDGETLQKYERHYWSGGGGSNVTCHVWTKCPSVASTGTLTSGYLYWGKAGDSDGEDAANVWDANHKGVWHLREDGNGTASEYKDSKGSAHAQESGTVTRYTGGPFAYAADCGGGHIYTSASLSHGIGTGDFTYEAFFNNDTNVSWGGLCSNGTYVPGLYPRGVNNNYGIYWGASYDSGVGQPSTGAWHHYSVRRTSGTIYHVIDGVEAGTTHSISTSMANAVQYFGSDNYTVMDGKIAEVRLSVASRTTPWSKFVYRNAVESDNEISWADIEDRPTEWTATATTATGSWTGVDTTATGTSGSTATATTGTGAWTGNTATPTWTAPLTATASTGTGTWAGVDAAATYNSWLTAAATVATGTWTGVDATATGAVALSATATTATGTWTGVDATPTTGAAATAEAALGTWTANAATATCLVVVTAAPVARSGVWTPLLTAATYLIALTAAATSASGAWTGVDATATCVGPAFLSAWDLYLNTTLGAGARTMYPRNTATPPPLCATVVAANNGAAITDGVVAKYSTGGGSQGAGAGVCQHEGNGQWSYTPTQAETDVAGFAIQFYHANAVGSGPTVCVVTTDLDDLAATIDDTLAAAHGAGAWGAGDIRITGETIVLRDSET